MWVPLTADVLTPFFLSMAYKPLLDTMTQSWLSNITAQASEGRQLFCEAIAILGCVLLTLDRKFPGPMRERVVVAFLRMKGGIQAAGPSANAVIALCAVTGLDSERGKIPTCKSFPPHSALQDSYKALFIGRLPYTEEGGAQAEWDKGSDVDGL